MSFVGGSLFILFVGFVFFGVLLAAISGGADNGDDREFLAGASGSGNELLSIDVSGVILGEDQGDSGFFGLLDVTYGYDVKEQLYDAADDDSVKGVVLEMSTPGGTIYGASAIADGVAYYQEATGNPVVAFVQDLSASGGMYAMAGADQIYADTGTLVGSIGVILGPIQYYDGLTAQDGGAFVGGVETENGIKSEFITGGRGKDMGSPYRPLTPEERAVLQTGVNTAYDQFVRRVSQARDIPEQIIRDQIAAFIYGEVQAQELGLIDGIANQQEAYSSLADLAGLRDGDFKVVREKSSTGLFTGLFSKAVENGVEVPTEGICFSPNEMLAYYGDPRTLCPN